MKFVAPLSTTSGKKYYQFTAIDDCTRVRVLRIYDRLNQKTAIQFVDYVLDNLPFRVEAIQTDNGSEFQTAFQWQHTHRRSRHCGAQLLITDLDGHRFTCFATDAN